MKKIGILTYLREYSNLGTNMQGYCTLKAIASAFPDSRVELIDYASQRPVMKPYLSGMSARSLKNDVTRMAKYKRFFRQQLVFSKDRLISGDPDASLKFIRDQHYDAIYVGSDTVLELRHATRHALTPFWLHPSIKTRKSLIAASCHSLTYDALSASQRKQIQATVETFSLLGARDEATQRLLSHFTGAGDRRLRLVPDPTFTYDIDYGPVDRYLADRGTAFDRPVVCLHLLRNTPWAAELAAQFRRAGYAIASLRPAPYADMIFTDLSPFEQMGLYRHFSLVITHRFHDTVFCFKNQTPVIVFPEYGTDVTSYGESRIHTLLKSFGLDMPPGMGSAESLTADYLFAIHKGVIAEFGLKREHIESVLRDNRVLYQTFVRDSGVAA